MSVLWSASALEAQGGPRFSSPHLEPTSYATPVYGNWANPARPRNSQEGKVFPG